MEEDSDDEATSKKKPSQKKNGAKDKKGKKGKKGETSFVSARELASRGWFLDAKVFRGSSL